MSAELLRAAAKTLRHSVAELPAGVQADWSPDGAEIYAGPEREWVAESLHLNAPDDGKSISVYLTTMHPPVALALAECMDQAAWMGEHDADLLLRVAMPELVNVARAILREAVSDATP